MIERKINFIAFAIFVLFLSTLFATTKSYGFREVAQKAAPYAETLELHTATTKLSMSAPKAKPSKEIVKIVTPSLSNEVAPKKMLTSINNEKPSNSSDIDFEALFTKVSKITGVSKAILFKFAAIESGFKVKAASSKSTAKGLFQFTDDTWQYVTHRFGKPYGITEKTSRYNPFANALMAGFHIQSNLALIKENKKTKHVKDADLYLVHLLGRTGSIEFFKTKPNVKIARKMPQAARNNRRFFYVKGKPATKTQMVAIVERHIHNKMNEFNLAS